MALAAQADSLAQGSRAVIELDKPPSTLAHDADAHLIALGARLVLATCKSLLKDILGDDNTASQWRKK